MLGVLLTFPLSVRAQQCSGPGDPICDDGIACTDDSCFIGFPPYYCVHGSNCSNGDFCDGIELCCTTPGGCGTYAVGQCVPGEDIVCPPGQYCSEDLDDCVYCEENWQCDDGNPCTEDTCNMATGCQYQNISVSCSDDDLCTEGDVCGLVCVGGDHDGEICGQDSDCIGVVSGTCSEWVCRGVPKTCDPPPCHAGGCNPATGDCEYITQENGTACDLPGDTCWAQYQCEDGICVGFPADECVDLELWGPTGGSIQVGDILEFDLMAWSNGCPPSPICPGSIQAVSAVRAVLSWDPEVLELADPVEIGEPNPEDPCDDPNPCEYDCGYLGAMYNWNSSGFPNDCEPGFGDALNAPCAGIPDNDGDAYYNAFKQLLCDGDSAFPACVQGLGSGGFHVTTIKFKAIGPTKGVSGPTQLTIENCIVGVGSGTRTFVVSGSTTGHDVTGSLGIPAEVEVACVDGSDCPMGICENGVCVSCPPPEIVTLGSRYIGVTPQPGPAEVAILVEGVDAEVSCVSGYVQFDEWIYDGDDTGKVILGEPPYYLPVGQPGTPPSVDGWGTVPVRGAGLVGGMTYSVQADCDPQNPGVSLSEPVTATLWHFGDTNNTPTYPYVEILDAVRVLDGFRGMFHITIPSVCNTDQDCEMVPPHRLCDLDVHKCRWIYREEVDLYGGGTCAPNRVIEIVDAVYSLDGFRGMADWCVPCP